MTRIAYVNGRYQPTAQAGVHIEDRGYQFSDGVYEVIAFFNRVLVDEAPHLERLYRSLKELGIKAPMSQRALEAVMHQLIRRNPLEDGSIYIQVSRGVAKRDHVYKPDIKPALVMTVARSKGVNRAEIEKGAKAWTREDIRWARRDIKSISLLPNAMLKHEAAQAGMREAWLVDAKGYVTEASVSNAFIVDAKGRIITRESGKDILSGITRMRLLAMAKQLKIPVVERAFTVAEALKAKEAFVASSTSLVAPIVELDGKKIGNGKPGAITLRLFTAYMDYIEQETGKRIWNA